MQKICTNQVMSFLSLITISDFFVLQPYLWLRIPSKLNNSKHPIVNGIKVKIEIENCIQRDTNTAIS